MSCHGLKIWLALLRTCQLEATIPLRYQTYLGNKNFKRQKCNISPVENLTTPIYTFPKSGYIAYLLQQQCWIIRSVSHCSWVCLQGSPLQLSWQTWGTGITAPFHAVHSLEPGTFFLMAMPWKMAADHKPLFLVFACLRLTDILLAQPAGPWLSSQSEQRDTTNSKTKRGRNQSIVVILNHNAPGHLQRL